MGLLQKCFSQSVKFLPFLPLAAMVCAAQTAPAYPIPPIRLTLEEALRRAPENSASYLAAVTDAGLAHEDKKQAIAGLLPSVNYNNSAIYTQGSGVGTQVRFLANNGVHEYISQGDFHQGLELAAFAEARRAAASAAAARARREIASRGLMVTVVQAYYAVAAAQEKLQVAGKAADEGGQFLALTEELERGGEVAHADVIKSRLQANDRLRQLQEAKLAFLNARLDLALLIFPDYNDNFELADDLHAKVELPSFVDVEVRASHNNPDVRAAVEALRASQDGVLAARAGYLPSLSVDYFYGIDAAHFAVKTDGVTNLGSSVVATVNIPIWNWGSTQSKIRQAELRRDQAQRELSVAQRKILAELHSLYAEAQTAAEEASTLRESAQLGQESLRLATLRYRNGESTVLEVVDAQNAATLAQNAYEDGAVRYRVALANLQTLTGGLNTQ